MTRSLIKCITAALSALLVGAAAQASVTFTLVEGNDSVNTLLTGMDNGGFVTIQQDPFFGTATTNTASGSLLTDPSGGLFLIGKTDGGGNPIPTTGGGNGTNSLTFDATGFNIFAIAVKAGNGFLLLDFTSMVNGFTGSGTVCTNGSCSILGESLPQIFTGGNPNDYDPPFTGKNNPGISHISYYGLEDHTSTVPEPATWLMLIIGFAITGFASRRRLRVA